MHSVCLNRPIYVFLQPINLSAVNVIKGALHPVSIPTIDTYIPNLVGDAWTPPVGGYNFINPDQTRELNLKAAAITRTVGGMATHWTCSCRTYIFGYFMSTIYSASPTS